MADHLTDFIMNYHEVTGDSIQSLKITFKGGTKLQKILSEDMSVASYFL